MGSLLLHIAYIQNVSVNTSIVACGHVGKVYNAGMQVPLPYNDLCKIKI